MENRKHSIVRLQNPEMICDVREDQIDQFFAGKIFRVITILRIDFRKSAKHRKINAVITSILLLLGVYSILFNIKITFSTRKVSAELAAQLLIILWAIQSLISALFLIYWQVNGHFSEFRKNLQLCQGFRGLSSQRQTKSVFKTNLYFHSLISMTCLITFLFALRFHLTTDHTEFSEKQSYIFYFPQLRPLYTLITTYLYIVWTCTLFVLILYTNATYYEMRYFNTVVETFDGSTDEAADQLLNYLEIYSNLCAVIRQLDLIFRLYTFIMIVITIPSMIFTLMTMNHRIHSFFDFLICMPTISLCAFSFFSVTIAPARLHDEISRTKGCVCQNRSIWIPYREKVYLIANTLTSHMEQFDLGVSVWGFAVLSRPLILGTLSATGMMLSLLTELAPKTDLLRPA